MGRKRKRLQFKPEKLERLRVKAGLSKAELARRMAALEDDPPEGRAASLRTCISRWSSGVHPPTGSSLFVLASALGVEPRQLYG